MYCRACVGSVGRLQEYVLTGQFRNNLERGCSDLRGHLTAVILRVVTCRTQRAALLSPGATIRNGPSLASIGFPSRLSARMISRVANAGSTSATAKATL